MSKGEVPEINNLVWFHIIGGSVILAFAAWRLALRMKRGVPALPEKEAPLLKGLAHLTHWSLYALTFILPMTGLLEWFGGSQTAGLIHTSLKLPLLGLVGLHFVAALFQQFVLRTGLINRMLRAEG